MAWGGFEANDVLQVLDAEAAGAEEGFGEAGGERLRAAGPDCEDHGQAGHFTPFVPQIEAGEAQAVGFEAEGRVADDQSGVRGFEHRGQVGRHGNGYGLSAIAARENDAGQHGGGARTGIEGQGADAAGTGLGHHAADGAVASDPGAGDDGQALAGGLDGRHDADVGRTRFQAGGAFRRQAEGQVE